MAKLPLPGSIDKRFDVEISVRVTKEDANKPMAETVQLYRGMDYVQMQITQSTAIRALAEALIGVGDAVVAEITGAAAALGDPGAITVEEAKDKVLMYK